MCLFNGDVLTANIQSYVSLEGSSYDVALNAWAIKGGSIGECRYGLIEVTLRQSFPEDEVGHLNFVYFEGVLSTHAYLRLFVGVILNSKDFLF